MMCGFAGDIVRAAYESAGGVEQICGCASSFVWKGKVDVRGEVVDEGWCGRSWNYRNRKV